MKSEIQAPLKVVLLLSFAVVLFAALHFGRDLDKVVTWPSEFAVLAESWKAPQGNPLTPHLDYQSPAYRWALRTLGIESSSIIDARRVSWAATTLAVAAIIAAGWTLFSAPTGLAAGLLAVGAMRMLSAAQFIGTDAFLLLFQGVTIALFGLGLRSNRWAVWIALFGVSLAAALSGFQSVVLLLAVTAVGAAYVSSPGKHTESSHTLPIWQFVSTIPLAFVLSAFWVVTWVLGSRDANLPIAKPPIMSFKYFFFVHSYLLGHAPWAIRLMGAAAVVGIIGSLRKRVVRIEKLRRVYVDKRSRRPMFFLLFWLLLGLPALNLLLFNARRVQDPVVLNTLVLPLLLITAQGITLLAEWLQKGLRRLVGVRLPALIVLLIIAGPICWFCQEPARQTYVGYKIHMPESTHWEETSSFLRPRVGLAQDAIIAPSWAGALVRNALGDLFSDLRVSAPTLRSHVDSLVRESPSAWAIIYQSEIYPPIPERVRHVIDDRFEEVTRFQGSHGVTIIVMATPWLHVSETQWNLEQERLTLGGEEGAQARLNLARLYLDAGNTDVAARELGQLVAESPTNFDALMELAALREREGKKGHAVNLYRRAANADSTSADAHFRLGRVHMAVGRLPAAINELERALELDPQELAAAQLLAEAYISVDRSGDAARLQELVEEMGGRIILEYEFGRIIGVRSLEIPAGSWGLGEEIELGLEWTVVRPAAGEFKPDLYLSGGTSRLLIKPPRGGWQLSVPDSGMATGQRSVDFLPLQLTYSELPVSYPDYSELSLDILDASNQPLPVTDRRGERLTDAKIGTIIGWRESGREREVVEAEEMEQHPGFQVPGGINVTDIGLFHTLRFPGGPLMLEIMARGVPAGGQWPRMIVELSDHKVADIEVNERDWRTYRVSVAPPPGSRPVRIRFPNDYINPTTGEDRNLVVDKVSVIEEEILFRLEAVEAG